MAKTLAMEQVKEKVAAKVGHRRRRGFVHTNCCR